MSVKQPTIFALVATSTHRPYLPLCVIIQLLFVITRSEEGKKPDALVTLLSLCWQAGTLAYSWHDIQQPC